MNCNLSGSSVRWDSPGKKTGVGYRALLQGIFQPKMEPVSPALTGGLFTTSATWEAQREKHHSP